MHSTGPRYGIGDFANAQGRQGGFSVLNGGIRLRFGENSSYGAGRFSLALRAGNLPDREYDELITFASFLGELTFQPGAGRRVLATVQYEI